MWKNGSSRNCQQQQQQWVVVVEEVVVHESPLICPCDPFPQLHLSKKEHYSGKVSQDPIVRIGHPTRNDSHCFIESACE